MSAPTCPTCLRAAPPRAGNPTFPFCSERCRLVDLGRWLGEEYRIPDVAPADGGAADQPPGTEVARAARGRW